MDMGEVEDKQRLKVEEGKPRTFLWLVNFFEVCFIKVLTYMNICIMG